MSLRPYQRNAVNMLYEWVRNNPNKNVCLTIPTGGGKSHIIATICKEAAELDSKVKILMVTHTKEIVKQNSEKLRLLWPNAPLGIYSAGLGKKDIDQITFAGIQSVRNKPELFYGVSLVICDEAHMISHEDTGGYRFFLGALKDVNPNLVVVGLTASPFRLGHGMITDDPAIFDDILEPVSIPYLQDAGFLADLRSKVTKLHLLVDGVKKRGGDFIESELQKSVDTELQSDGAVDEVLRLAGDRRSWLFFCAGVDHAEHIKEILLSRGIVAACVTGETPKNERDQILEDYKNLKIKAITNANILTTGFDFPGIDLIVMLRPTCSPGLYVQMAGRGLRLKDHTDHCLILDFAGVVEMHGPIQFVRPPSKKGGGDGVAPCKLCPECDEIIHISVMVCPSCGFVFKREEKKHVLHDDDIMGRDLENIMPVSAWEWSNHTSKAGNESIMCRYMGRNLSDGDIKEYFSIFHPEERVRGFSIRNLKKVMTACGCTADSVDALNSCSPPISIKWIKEKGFQKIVSREFEESPF